jgi:hydroxymethylpyrimidine kinase / phosphomethylpyrimidine kinase / thiamine-phosphate diphosphorylase
MNKPIVWSIAGSDSGGGAGIQADLMTLNAFGVHGCTAVTCVTAQNTLGLLRSEDVSPTMLKSQLGALAGDLPPAVIKIGMIRSASVVRQIVRTLRDVKAFVILDPILAASGGQKTMDEEAWGLLVRDLLPRADLVTPNVPEAEALLGRTLAGEEDIERAGRDLVGLGAGSALITGGHRGKRYSQDYYTDGTRSAWLTSEMQETLHDHGTGCTLSAAIAAGLALEYDPLDALVLAKAYVNQGLREAEPIGKGRGPLYHGGWPSRPDDLPWLTDTAADGRAQPLFPSCGEDVIGLYPIVDRFGWVERLADLGVRTIQIRIKDMKREALEAELARCVEFARGRDLNLYVNDYWELAIRLGAYGVHLGQEDLSRAAVRALADAGLRLGISAYSVADIARAWAYTPSYIALGSIFPSGSKDVGRPPLGMEAFRLMRRLVPTSTVAIGGITLETAPLLIEAGADGLAVIADICRADDLEDRIRQWRELQWY